MRIVFSVSHLKRQFIHFKRGSTPLRLRNVVCQCNLEDRAYRASSGSFFRPATPIDYSRAGVCNLCGGNGTTPCGSCDGKGHLPVGGYHVINHVDTTRLIGSKWTAMERTLGWRHFHATQKRKNGRDTFVLLVATCDSSSQLWVNVKNLKDREAWAAGWLQKAELMEMVTKIGPQCKVCSGRRVIPCRLCSRGGQLIEV